MIQVLIVITERWCRKGKGKCIDIPIHCRIVGFNPVMIFLRFILVSRPLVLVGSKSQNVGMMVKQFGMLNKMD